MDFTNDSAAVSAAQAGDRGAFEWLVRRHERRALAVAIGVLHHREDARDACQEAFLRVFRALDRFDHHAQFSTWLYRIVVNICIDRLRNRSARLVALDDVEGVLAAEDDPARSVEGAQLGGRIGAALARLTPNHRTALVLREVQGLAYQGDRRGHGLLRRHGDVAAVPRAQEDAGALAQRRAGAGAGGVVDRPPADATDGRARSPPRRRRPRA